MKIRTRIALALALCLVLAGAAILLVNEAAIESGIDTDFSNLQSQLYKEIGVSRKQAERYLREHPDAALEFDADAPIFEGGRSLNQVFRDILQNAQRKEIDKTRQYTLLAILLLALAAGVAGWLIARRSLKPARLIAQRAAAANASDLTQRVALGGPNDEMKELSNTFDDMLARLERSFDAQRHFASQVSHELRTPLAVIRSESDLLRLDDESPEARRRAAERIREAGLRAEHLIESLLALSRAEGKVADPQRIDLDELVGAILEEIVSTEPWNRTHVDLTLDDATVTADPQLLRCVVENLLDNAGAYSPEGDSIAIDVATDGTDPKAAVLAIENAASAPDIALVRAALEGDPTTVRATARGNGIGLSVVASIVDALGGELRVVTKPERVRIEVRLPALGAPVSQQRTAST